MNKIQSKARIIISVSILLLMALALIMFVLPGLVSAAGDAIVTVSVLEDTINPGQDFSFDIGVIPNNAIAGMQFSLNFDPAVATVVDVTEGDLFQQNGDDTYFNAGSINNTSGTITEVFGAILNPGQDISGDGIFATIHMTAIAIGTSPLTLSNVVVGNVESQSVPVDTKDGSVTIELPNAPTPIPTPTLPSGGGGGGSSGGSSVVGEKRSTFLISVTSNDFYILDDVEALSVDIKVSLLIPQGTKVLNSMGYMLPYIVIEKLVAPPEAPTGTEIIGGVYDLSPDGAIFDPAVQLIIKYDEDTLPEGFSPDNLYIAYWNEDTETWEKLASVIDIENHTISVFISHLSTYAIMASPRPATMMASLRPAEFQVSNLKVTPATVEVGDTVTIDVLVTNTGELAGNYTVSLGIDGTVVETKEITLDGAENITVSFPVAPDATGEHEITVGDVKATFQVRNSAAPASFIVEKVKVDPLQVNPGDTVTVSAVVQNTGETTRTYHAVLTVNDTEAGNSDITLDSGDSQTVSFDLVEETPGIYQVSINGLVVPPFEVITPAFLITPATVEDSLEIASFNVIPNYDGGSNKIAYAGILFEMNQNWESFPDAKLMLTVFHDGQFLEQVQMLTLSQQQNINSGEFNYVPEVGWEAGEYAFRAELYQGDSLIQDTSLLNLNGMPVLLKVVSWKFLGIIIGGVLVIGIITLVLVLRLRRDKKDDYWR